MNDIADKQNPDRSKPQHWKIGLIVLLFFSGFVCFCAVTFITHRAALEDSYHEYAKSTARFPLGEIMALHLEQNPQKFQLLTHLDALLYGAEFSALQKDYAKMHETLSEAVKVAIEVFGPKSEFLRAVYTTQGNHESDFKKWNESIDAYSHAIEIDSTDAITYNCRARSYFKIEKFQSSIDDLTKAIALDPKSIGLYRFRAHEYGLLQKYQDALSDYNTIIALAPRDGQAYLWRGYTFFQLGQYPKAIADLNKVIEIDPKEKDTYYWLGRIYEQLGESEKARELYSKS
jgi:tetratricopeptide (TPR) repeat protein